MPVIPAAVVSPATTVVRNNDAKSAAPEESGQPFDGVLSREISRQAGEKSAQADAAAKDNPVANKVTQTESTADQQAAASPWLLMLQQFGQPLPVEPLQTPLVSQSEEEKDANPSDALLQWVQQSVMTASAADVPVDAGQPAALPRSIEQSGLPDGVAVQNLSQLAANVSTGIGKELPLALHMANEQSAFSDALGDSLNKVGDAQAQQSLQSAQIPLLKNEPGAVTTHNNASPYAISEQVGDTRWGGAVAQRVSMMLGRQEQHMEMQLNPPHLGPMEVRLTLGQDQASVVFASQHAAVREALAAATPRLTALLADQGIQLVNVQVASDSLQQQAQEQSRNQAALRDQNQSANSVLRQSQDAPIEVRSLAGLGLPVARSGVSLFI